MSEYYAVSGNPSTGASGASAPIRSEFSLISAGFDKLPTLNNSADLPIFVNSGATALTTVSASSARTKLGLSIGNNVQAYSAQLDAFANLGNLGVVVLTAANTVAARTLTGTTNEITVTNGNGVAGNQTLSLPATLTFTGKTITGGTFNTPSIVLANSNAMVYAGAGGTVAQTAAANNGQILIGSTGGLPVLNSLTAGSGITITNTPGGITLAAGAADILFANSTNLDIDITNGGGGGAVPILTKSVSGISAGDQVSLDIKYTIVNTSGNTQTYNTAIALGSMSTSLESNVTFTNLANRAVRVFQPTYAISAPNLTHLTSEGRFIAAIGQNSPQIGSVRFAWDKTTNNLLGTQTLNFSITTNNAAAGNQTLTLHSYVVRKTSPV